MKILNRLYYTVESASVLTALFCGAFLLWHFSQIVQRGEFFIAEPNLWILYSEITGLCFLMMLSLAHLILFATKIRRSK